METYEDFPGESFFSPKSSNPFLKKILSGRYTIHTRTGLLLVMIQRRDCFQLFVLFYVWIAPVIFLFSVGTASHDSFYFTPVRSPAILLYLALGSFSFLSL